MSFRHSRLLTVKQLKSYLYLKALGIEVSETARTNQRKYSECLTFVENIIKERYDYLIDAQKYKDRLKEQELAQKEQTEQSQNLSGGQLHEA